MTICVRISRYVEPGPTSPRSGGKGVSLRKVCGPGPVQGGPRGREKGRERHPLYERPSVASSL
eukprot:scaffold269_cov404-Prasinococcus_capsulatus_cf.AAC.2